jgi:hypothetical protein
MYLLIHHALELSSTKLVLQTYSSLLAFLSITLRSRINKFVTRHLIIVLLISWAVFAYRDIWPLCTFTLRPLDIKEGWIIWAKVALLTLAAIVVPVFIPQSYVPVDATVGAARLRLHLD